MYPDFIQEKLNKDPSYYSLYVMTNILRAREDDLYMSDLVIVNEGLVVHSITKYILHLPMKMEGCGVVMEDVLQLGRMALVKSIRAFDVNRGIKFSSFAVIAIVREIKDYLRNNFNLIRLSRGAQELYMKIRALEQQQDVEGDLGVGEIVKALNEPRDKVEFVLRAMHITKNLMPLFDNTQSQVTQIWDGPDSIALDSVVDEMRVDELINKLRLHLSEKEVKVFELAMEGKSHVQVARKLNMSNMKVSRVISKLQDLIKDTYARERSLNYGNRSYCCDCFWFVDNECTFDH